MVTFRSNRLLTGRLFLTVGVQGAAGGRGQRLEETRVSGPRGGQRGLRGGGRRRRREGEA